MTLKVSKSQKAASKALASSPSDSFEETTALLREVVSSKSISSAIATPSSFLESQENISASSDSGLSKRKKLTQQEPPEDGEILRKIPKQTRYTEEMYPSDEEGDRALARDMINFKRISYVCSTKSHFSVCSGLDNTCYSSNKMLDLYITYVNEISKQNNTILLTAFISENSPIDLIIGRSTIKKNSFFQSNPSHFADTKPSDDCGVVAPKKGMKNTNKEGKPSLQLDHNINLPMNTCSCTSSVS